MSFREEHELHKRRSGLNIGVGLVLAAFIVLIFGLTVAKVTGGDMQMPSSEEVGATSDGNG